MNCEHLRDSLYEYLDDSLSPSDKSAAQTHLAECASCREALQREKQLAQALSSRFEHSVQSASLNPRSQHQIAAAMERKLSAASPRIPIPFWKRWALPLAAAAVVLVCAVWTGRHLFSKPGLTPDFALHVTGDEVAVHVSYSVPHYIFQRDGNMVVDALVNDPHDADGTLLVNN